MLQTTKNITSNVCKKRIKSPLVKTLIKGSSNSSGRNNLGKITSYHRGGGHKKSYRSVNFFGDSDTTGIITSVEYDPNRSSSIMSLYDIHSSSYSYRLAPKGSRVGDIIKTGPYSELKLGHSLQLKRIPVGSCLHCVALRPHKKSLVSRAAGSYAKLLVRTREISKIVVSSSKKLELPVTNYATLGVVSEESRSLSGLVKAGRSRWMNIRPTVRGVAMNPIDHPHGGGEGKTSGGRTSVTPWGKPTKGGRTSRSSRSTQIKL